MAFLFNDRIGGKPSTHPSNFAAADQKEYEALITKENGVSHNTKSALDNRPPLTMGKGVGVCGTCLNTFKCSVGAGILSFPYAFQLGGWLGGSVAFCAIILPVMYGLHRIGAARLMLIEDMIAKRRTQGLRADPSVTEDEIKRLALESRDYLEFPELARLSVGEKLSTVVAGFVLAGQIGCCSAYVIFMTNNLHGIGMAFAATSFLPRIAYVGILFPLIVSLSFVKTLRGLMPVALLGTLLLFAGWCLVGIHGFQAAAATQTPITLPPMLGENVVVCIGIMLFAMESVVQMPALQASMTSPSKFPTTLNFTLSLVFLLYVVFGIGGAALYGANVDSVITNNMGTTVLGHLARATFTVYILFSFPFQMFPAGVILERWFTPDTNAAVEDMAAETSATGDAPLPAPMGGRATCSALLSNFFVVRLLLCLIVAGIACAFQDFGTFLSLIGYPCMGVLGLVVPQLMCITLDMKSKNGRMSTLDRTLCWTVLCFGAVGCMVGTVYSVAEVMKASYGGGSDVRAVGVAIH